MRRKGWSGENHDPHSPGSASRSARRTIKIPVRRGRARRGSAAVSFVQPCSKRTLEGGGYDQAKNSCDWRER